MRLAVVASHPIQYQAPLFRALARRLDLVAFFAHAATQQDQAQAGFGVGFDWDVDLLSGYENRFLDNVAVRPGLDHFGGCDTPGIGAQLRAARCDVLLVMGWHLKCFWQAIAAAKHARIPVMVRGDSQLATPRSAAKRLAKATVYPIGLRAFDAALYVGEASRRYWEHYRYPRKRLFFSPHCVDNDWFAARATRAAGQSLRSARGIAPDAKVLLFAGKLAPGKRPLDLLAASEILNAQGWKVTTLIAGSGPLEEAAAAAARRGGAPLVQLGFCNQSQMPAAYAAADVLVLPSDGGETWGLVANESLACGVPIVVSDACGCAPDLAADGSAGRVFPVGDIGALVAAIQDMIAAPPPPAALAARIADYSVAAAADGVLAGAAATLAGKRRAK